MQHMKTVEVPATTKQVVDKTTCDFCGAEIRDKVYDATEVTIEARTGTRYPEGGSGDLASFDCCLPCWKSKVVPAFAAMGANPRVVEWDF